MRKLTKIQHVSKRINNILSYLDTEKRTKTRLIVTHIFPNSYLSNLEMLDDFDIIDKINGNKCNNIEQFRKHILQVRRNSKGKYIELETELNKKVILDISDIVSEEASFAETYKYPISKTFLKLKRMNTGKKTKKNSTPKKLKMSKKSK